MKYLVLSRTLENIRKGSDVTACDVGKRVFLLEEEVRRGALGGAELQRRRRTGLLVLGFKRGGERTPSEFLWNLCGQNEGPGRGSHDGWNDEAYFFPRQSPSCAEFFSTDVHPNYK
ncbi:hypothetical protein AVEN_83363-1 [Araneus ventricosus]|uniref:Uncharacterized protein n=1 Tax=Araneus ventricosus TaxID=182803 RepID=A0A4Y2LQF0_ARAVE|nr:hypothetical protein AVEN_83363-1 [Araneus ventricosus]